MERIPLLERDRVSDEIRSIYDAMLEKRGAVPNMIKTVAHAPELVKGLAAFMAPLMGAGEIPQQLKELIATYVSLKNNCHY